MTDQPLSEAFALIAELGISLGAAPLTKHVGCWEHRLSDRWFIAVNGHGTPTKTTAGDEVPPYHAYVERDGWPAGIFRPDGAGEMMGHGGVEDELIAELKAAIGKGTNP